MSMRFTETPLPGAYLIDLDKRTDERGFFARVFSIEEFAEAGLETQFVHMNNSLSIPQGTLRGLHYQLAPKQEVKLLRCIRGSLYDVILDIRPDSPTFGKSFGAELSAENRRMMYVPKGFAHGFLTLTEHAEVVYFVSEVYSPKLERGIRWDDPQFSVKWPAIPQVISERDLSHPNFDPKYHLNMTFEGAST
jgi:dTDP-4-dehydrorhamnose 3,5-epimerase